ncbi:MAG: CPBP family intramembrane metalloprotease [Clostridia bacterium]|nr:CPBP family intramembrane metalloprotease [Clostridia bacterium]
MTKKYDFKKMGVALLKVLGYVGLYFASSVVGQLIVTVGYTVLGKDTSDSAMEAFLLSNALELTLVTNAIFIIALSLIHKINNKSLSQGCDIYIVSRGYLTVIVTAVAAQLFVGGALTLLIAYELLPDAWIANHAEASVSIVSSSLGMQIFSAGIIGPIAEELLFRGSVQRTLNTAFPKWVGIILSALIFALLHSSEIQIIYALLLGVLIGWIYARFQSIFPTIIFHILYNISSLFLPDAKDTATLAVVCFISVMAMAWGIHSIYKMTKKITKIDDTHEV